MKERTTLGREEAEDGGALHGECTDIPSCSSSLALPPLAISVFSYIYVCVCVGGWKNRVSD